VERLLDNAKNEKKSTNRRPRRRIKKGQAALTLRDKKELEEESITSFQGGPDFSEIGYGLIPIGR